MLTVWSRQSRRKRPANMNNRRRPNDGSGLVEGLLKRPAVQQGCVYGTHRSPCDVLHTGCSHYTYTLGVTFYIQVGVGLRASPSIRRSVFTYILASAFTTFVIWRIFALTTRHLRRDHIPSHVRLNFPIPSDSGNSGTPLK